MQDTHRRFLRSFWALVKPYWYSEERWIARGLLAVVIGLNLGLVYINVMLNQWNNAFYNTLQNMDKNEFFVQIGRFAMIAAAYIVVAVYQLYLNQMLRARTTGSSLPIAAPTIRTSASRTTSNTSATRRSNFRSACCRRSSPSRHS